MKDVFISGCFTTLSPLTYKVPELDDLPRIGGRVYLPSSAIRGKLRRMARDAIVEETGKKLDFTDLFFLTLGGLNNESKKGVKSESEGEDGTEESKSAKESYAIPVYQAAEKLNPLISLFGAGPGSPLAIPSKLFVQHALANGDTTKIVARVSPVRTDDARLSPAETASMVSENFFDQYLAQVSGQREGSALKAREEELKRLLRKEGADKDAIKEELKKVQDKLKEKPVSISNPGLSYEVIVPGTTLETSFRVMRATDNELALLMRAFARLAFNPVFGGKKAVGNGLVSGAFSVRVRENGKMTAPTQAGYFEWSGDFTGLARIEGEPKTWLEMPLPYDELKFDYKSLSALAA